MPRKLYRFKQAESYPGKGGVCFCLTALWCRNMLVGAMDKWQAPTGSADSRAAALVTPQAKRLVYPQQGLFIAKNRRLRRGAMRLDLGNQAAGVMNRRGHAAVARDLLGALDVAADDMLAAAAANIEKTITAFELVIFAGRSGTAWSELPLKLQLKRAHIVTFSTGDTVGHAIAIYQTDGFFSTDFYVFEPNFGEFHCSGDSDLLHLIRLIMDGTAEYHNPTNFRVYELRAT